MQEKHGEDGTGGLEAATLQMMDMLKDEALSTLIDDMNNSRYFTVGESEWIRKTEQRLSRLL